MIKFVSQIDFGDAKRMDEAENEQTKEEEVAAPLHMGAEEEGVNQMMEDFTKYGGGRRGTMVGTVNYVSPEMITE